MPDHSGLATPRWAAPPFCFYKGGGSPMRQGGVAGMNPREGKTCFKP
jgi:hypothetical protein